MIQRILPIYKTGWFYLLLVMWTACYWLLVEGGFNRLNQFNLYALFQSSALQSKESSVSRFHVSLTEKNYSNVAKLLAQYPETTVLLVGSPTQDFLNSLQAYLRTHPQQAKVLIASEFQSSKLDLSTESNSFFSPFLYWFRELPTTNIHTENTKQFIYAPLLTNKRDQIPMFYQGQEHLYLTLMGEIIRQVENDYPITLTQDWQLTLANKNKLWPLGFSGDVVAAVDIVQATPLDSLNFKKAAQSKLFILDTDNGAYGDKISRMSASLLDKNYLYQTVTVKLVQYLLLIVGLYLLWFIRESHTRFQFKILSSYVGLMFILQYFLATENLWLELMPSIVVLFSSWGILLAYLQEIQIIASLNLRYNQLLGDNLSGFYQRQNMTELSKVLAETAPDLTLVDKVFTLALKAEKNHELTTAKSLFNWIVNSGVTHQGAKDKLISYRQHSTNPAINRLIPSNKPSSKLSKKAATKKSKTSKMLGKKSSATTSPSDSNSQATKAQYQSPISQAKPKIKMQTNIVQEDELEQTMVIEPGQKPPNLTATGSFKAEQFGRYQVEGILGRGAMGIVYQGVDPKINRHVAIKTLQLNDGIDEDEIDEAKARFFREAETAGNLSHANIVTIYDVGEEDSLGYIAMDLLTGAPLSHFIKKGQLLHPALVYQLMIQITDALDYAHKQNVVHRDIKPGNVIYDDDLQRATVTDFGIAYVSDNSKTRTGVIMGSPYYMSPEQILGKQVDGRSDIFSLGATFYQLLSGCLPFEGESVVSVVYQITNEKHISVTKCNEKLPASAARITNKAMNKDIDKRYQTMQEFKQALINALKRDFKKAPII